MDKMLELPKEVYSNEPKIILTGFDELIIENFKGILEYEEYFVRINTYIGIININGYKHKERKRKNERERDRDVRGGERQNGRKEGRGRQRGVLMAAAARQQRLAPGDGRTWRWGGHGRILAAPGFAAALRWWLAQ